MSDGAEIGHAYLSILPSAKGMGSRLTTQIGPELTKSGKKSGRHFGEVYGKAALGPLRAFGEAAAGLFVLDKAKNFVQGTIALARQEQKVTALTAQVIKTTGGAAHVSAVHVAELSDAISNNTGISHLAIQGGARLLLTFTNIRNEVGKGNAIYDQATRAVNDLSAGLGVAMPSAARVVGRALNDPIKGTALLTRYGIQFSDALKTQLARLVAHHKLLEAQKVVLAQLSTRFGGAAKASTTMGEKVGVAFENIKEKIGTALLPAVDSIEKRLLKVLPAALRVGHRLATTLGTPLRRGLSAVRSLIADHILPAGGALAVKAKRTAADLIDKLKAAITTGKWSDLGKALGSLLTSALTSGLALIGKATDAITSAFAKVDWGSVGLKVGKGAVKFVTGFVIGFLANLTDALVVLKDHWWQAILAALAIIPVGRIAGPLEKVVSHIPILRIFSPVLRAVERFGRLLEKVFSATIGRAARFFGRAFIDGFEREGGPIFGALRRLISSIVTHIYVWVDDFVKAARALISGFVLALRHNFERVGAWFARTEGRIVGFFRNAGSWLIAAGTAIISGLYRGIVSKFNDVKNFVGSIGGWIKSHKGPLSYDRTLLIPAGHAIMGGLVVGLNAGMRGLTKQLHTITHAMTHFADQISVKSVAHDFTTTWTKALNDLGNQLDRLKTRLSGLRSARHDLAASISSTLITGASFSNSPTSNLTGLISFKRQQAAHGRLLRRDLGILAKRGLSKSEVADLAGQGLDALPTVISLTTATSGQLAHIDALDRHIKANAKAIGGSVAGSIYNPQLDAIGRKLDGLRGDVRRVGTDITDAEQGIHRHHQLKTRTRTGGKK